MNTSLQQNTDYKYWLKDLKQKVVQTQIKAALTVNSHLLQLYWELGEDIVKRQANAQWGDGFLNQLSTDLIAEFPDIKGFSKRNLELIRQWYLFYMRDSLLGQQAVGLIATQVVSQLEPSVIKQQLVAQLTQIPWGHNLKIIRKCRTIPEALYYVQQTQQQGWSRNILVHQIDSGLYQREGKTINNFAATLPPQQSELAQQTLKDPYVFDFLNLNRVHNERQLEQSLIDHITQFLLELGSGFAYVGKQFPIQVGQRDFYLDLLFYHTRLHCYVVIELKIGDFEPEHAGKLNFYLNAIDQQHKQTSDAPTIGIRDVTILSCCDTASIK